MQSDIPNKQVASNLKHDNSPPKRLSSKQENSMFKSKQNRKGTVALKCKSNRTPPVVITLVEDAKNDVKTPKKFEVDEIRNTVVVG
jgi:hypothetical protein